MTIGSVFSAGLDRCVRLWAVRWRSWRASNAWGSVVFWVLCWLILSLMFGMSMLIRSEQGLMTGLKMIQAKDTWVETSAKALYAWGEEPPADNSNPGENPPDAPSLAAQAQMIVDAVAPEDVPLIEWLRRMENDRLVRRELTVHIRPWDQLSERQKHLFAVQGITVKPWEKGALPPKRWDILTPDSQFWVERVSQDGTRPQTWVIHGVMSHMMSGQISRGNTIVDLDVVRVILWADELVAQEKWRAENPPPDLPLEIAPAHVVISVIPSTVSVVIMFWTTAGFVMIMVAIGSMLFALSGWDALRREGVFEPLISLPFHARWLVVEHVGFWLLCVACGLASAALVPALLMTYYDLPVFWIDLLKLVVSCVLAAGVVITFAIAVSVWVAKRWWRVWVNTILTLASLTVQLLYISAFSDTASLALFATSAKLWLALAAMALVALIQGEVIARRMERSGRLGFKKY